MKKRFAFLMLAVAIMFSLFSFTSDKKKKVSWYAFEDAVDLSMDEPRIMAILVYADWCGYCKTMEKQVFKKEDVASYLNEHFYSVKLNGEYKGPIEFEGQTYHFRKSGRRGYNEFAIQLLNGRMSYPTVVFLNENFEVINRLIGLQSKESFAKYIEYLNEADYENVSWEEYLTPKDSE